MKSKLLDSAVILAFLTGAFFAVGHLVEIRRANDMGIDVSLMPTLPPESVILIGALNAFIILGGLLIPAGLMVAATWGFWQSPSGRGRLWYGRRSNVVKDTVLPVVGLLAVTILVIDMILFLRLPDRLNPWSRREGELSPVERIILKEPDPAVQVPGLRLLANKEGWVVLKRPGDGGFFCVRADEIRVLVLGKK